MDENSAVARTSAMTTATTFSNNRVEKRLDLLHCMLGKGTERCCVRLLVQNLALRCVIGSAPLPPPRPLPSARRSSMSPGIVLAGASGRFRLWRLFFLGCPTLPYSHHDPPPLSMRRERGPDKCKNIPMANTRQSFPSQYRRTKFRATAEQKTGHGSRLRTTRQVERTPSPFAVLVFLA